MAQSSDLLLNSLPFFLSPHRVPTPPSLLVKAWPLPTTLASFLFSYSTKLILPPDSLCSCQLVFLLSPCLGFWPDLLSLCPPFGGLIRLDSFFLLAFINLFFNGFRWVGFPPSYFSWDAAWIEYYLPHSSLQHSTFRDSNHFFIFWWLFPRRPLIPFFPPPPWFFH